MKFRTLKNPRAYVTEYGSDGWRFAIVQVHGMGVEMWAVQLEHRERESVVPVRTSQRWTRHTVTQAKELCRQLAQYESDMNGSSPFAYQIQAVGYPSFLLQVNVLGITGPDHAESIARSIVGDDVGVSVMAFTKSELS